VWYFWAGISVTLISILAGLFAEQDARGKVFGILALNSGLGSLIGGLAMGPIADRWGYQAMFAVLSLFCLLWPFIALFLKDDVEAQAESTDTRAGGPAVGLGQSFYLLGLTVSTALWHFWLTSTLITVSFITGAVGTALVTDLVPREALGRGLALFGATNWIAGILGCAGAGYAVQHLGEVQTMVVGAVLPLVAVVLLIAIRRGRPAKESRTPSLGRILSTEPLPAGA
jgi:predicted MFS family arabinose efflux permease